MNYERMCADLQQRMTAGYARYEGDLTQLKEQALQEIEQRDVRISELEARVAELEAEDVDAEEKPATAVK